MNHSQTDVSIERPLAGAAKVGLALGAAGMIVLFYLFMVLSVAGLSLLLLVELGLVIALARFGAAGLMVRAMTEHLAALPVFLRSLRIKKTAEFRISLKPDEAPRLFALLENLCQRVEVRLPRDVALEMSSGAWVRLKGYRAGASNTTLGIGYDLMAGLSDGEVEAVLAHEMMHAKLVQRGFNQLLRGGLSRAVQLANALSAQVEAARRARRAAEVSKTFLSCADWFGRNCARLVASCSRQDEFAADLGATRVSAAGMLQSALLRIEHIDRNAARLPWRERVAQLQSGEGFGDWLRKELAATETTKASDVKAELRSKYSTHPSLRDRLAALPPMQADMVVPERSAIDLLADPDRVAEKLIAEIQRVIAQEEQKDSKQLDRWSRKVRSHSHLRPIQSLGIVAAALGLISGPIIWFSAGMSVGLLEFMGITIIPGVLCYRFGGYRERSSVPVPDFAVLKAAWQSTNAYDEAKAKTIEAELRERIGSYKKRSERGRLLAQEAYAALGRCEYLRTHTAATLCLKETPKSVEGDSALGIAAAALGQMQQVQWAVRRLQKSTRFTGPSAGWAAAWIFLLCGDWDHAEALLAEARKGRSQEPTLLALQALCQARRGKLQSAILNARTACEPRPRNKEYAKQLISLLLDGGFLREAEQHLFSLESEFRTDAELGFSVIRFKLMCRKYVEAEEWEGLYREQSKRAYDLVRLGALYESARKAEKAANYYNQALVAGHFPEALLGLARLEVERKNIKMAEHYALAAVDLKKPVGEGGAGPLQLLHRIFGQLVMLEEPVLNGRAWIATLTGTGGPPSLAQHSFMIFAANSRDAEERLRKVLSAMQPGSPPLLPNAILWCQAPKDQQPDGPVRLGVQGLV
jgi:Zn-dependent protease with chaperone function